MSNGVSALLALLGVAYLSFLMAIYQPAWLFCTDGTWGDVTPSPWERRDCLWKIGRLDVSWSGQEEAEPWRLQSQQLCSVF